ncbi:hypothetical protein GUJ93_ZPchr0009g124 [Zizania palustris]|uniref:PRA1 family protein n=1 Tax=Zizania palustris TaxID=103762 RepID=A0A8J5S6H2_ZIZPA|nr:hypothetical protein GUJ93_ZPchr0009g124 [Zizania palustris]
MKHSMSTSSQCLSPRTLLDDPHQDHAFDAPRLLRPSSGIPSSASLRSTLRMPCLIAEDLVHHTPKSLHSEYPSKCLASEDFVSGYLHPEQCSALTAFSLRTTTRGTEACRSVPCWHGTTQVHALLPITVLPAASPPLLPTTCTDTADADANLAAMRAFLGRLLDSVKCAFSGALPWPELVDRSTLSHPDSLSDATARLHKNLAYFHVNYVAVVALSLAAALLATPSPSSRSSLSSPPGASSTCSAPLTVFRVPEDFFVDESDQVNGGASISLLSFITNATGGRV